MDFYLHLYQPNTSVKKIVTTLLIVFSFTFCNAQWVTIPDANFVSFLQATYPTCMNGNQMNTSCSAITTATQIDCSSQNISDLTGLEYFTSLVYLHCDNNQLSDFILYQVCPLQLMIWIAVTIIYIFYLHCQLL